MKISNQLQTYYSLFSLIAEDPRMMPKCIAKRLKYSGTGRSPSTLFYHITEMYNKGISKKPRLFLKSFSETYPNAFFCKRNSIQGLYSTLRSIDKDPDISYAICLSSSDFFLMSRSESPRIEKFGLSLLEKSVIYTPVFPIPDSCRINTNAAFSAIPKYEFRKKKLDRKLLNGFNWDKLDWSIYNIMGCNVREKFTELARRCKTTPTTAKKHFMEKVLPNCVQVHYFFPKGQASYFEVFLRLYSEYEKGIIEILSKLPCTSFVYPIKKEIIVRLFHESIVVLLDTLGKLEEMAIIDGYLLFNPIAYSASE